MLEGSDSADKFFAGFYRDPQPRLAAEALAYVIAHPVRMQAGAIAMFVRAAQLSSDIHTEFRGLCERQPELAVAVTNILEAAADPTFPDAALIELKGAEDLDFLWGEFLLTGSDAPVWRIASVLRWEDRLRCALKEWASARVLLPRSKAEKARTAMRLAQVGLWIDNILDLDLLLWKLMSGGFQFRTELPFSVTDDLLHRIAMKGAACWSMQSNALAHPLVREVYDALPDRARRPLFVADIG